MNKKLAIFALAAMAATTSLYANAKETIVDDTIKAQETTDYEVLDLTTQSQVSQVTIEIEDEDTTQVEKDYETLPKQISKIEPEETEKKS
tara:strand:+ start:5088 stop:5357 length:270 start_codon:yes stop_codon:yes gene_type:complete